MLEQVWSVLLLCLGFGFVIFWHELGHFIAAKWVGIRVEQFAVGFGQAMLSWRKGMGVKLGSSGKKYEELVQARVNEMRNSERAELKLKEKVGVTESEFETATRSLGLGETEYRLNWIPLGGYVKMLGQDDLRPNNQAEDPRAYNKKSIGARMFVVSAGVIMNIILAAIGFMIVFRIGFRAPPPVIGSILSHSPAQQTVDKDGKLKPLQVGDRILYLDNKWQHDFTKISLNIALSDETTGMPVHVRRVDGHEETLRITPRRAEGDANGFLAVGIEPPRELRGIDVKEKIADEAFSPELVSDQVRAIRPGDTIVAVNGEPVAVPEYFKLDRAIQAGNGAPIPITVKASDGKEREVSVQPHFQRSLDIMKPLDFGGLVPRAVIEQINIESPARKKLFPGDVIVKIAIGTDEKANPTIDEVMSPDANSPGYLKKAGDNGQIVDMVVLRDGKEVSVTGLTPNVKLEKNRKGLSVSIRPEEQTPVIAGTVKDSSAASSGITPGSLITLIDGKPIKTWFDVRSALAQAAPDKAIVIATKSDAGEKEFEIKLTRKQIDDARTIVLTSALQLHERVEPRKTDSLMVAAAWGVTETRDFVLQFYLTIHRMFQGSVSYKNMMGPVGIFNVGRQFAFKGTDWLIWFLSMISANLAVVNFLPIPIVDGGLFTFLIIEKLQGKPLSAKAQSIAQVVGLALLLSVFLLVTYQDIMR